MKTLPACRTPSLSGLSSSLFGMLYRSYLLALRCMSLSYYYFFFLNWVMYRVLFTNESGFLVSVKEMLQEIRGIRHASYNYFTFYGVWF